MNDIYQIIIKIMADVLMFPIIAISGYMLLFKIPSGCRFKAYSRVVIVGLTVYLIAKLVGIVYQPTGLRPFELLGLNPGASYLNNPGFPSDHALFAMFLALSVWFETKKKEIFVILITLTILMCIGRVAALVHTLLDVIGGLLIASVGSLWYVQDKSIKVITKTRKKCKR